METAQDICGMTKGVPQTQGNVVVEGKGTTDAIFMARQMQENFRVKGKKLYIQWNVSICGISVKFFSLPVLLWSCLKELTIVLL